MQTQTIILASGSRLLREMLSNIITKNEQLEVVQELPGLAQIPAAMEKFQPDWVIAAPVDHDLPITALHAIMARHPETRLLLFPLENSAIQLNQLEIRKQTLQGLSLSQLLKIIKQGYKGEEYFVNGIKRQDLKELIHHSDGPCVSLYMPTHGAGQESQQDPLRLKNLLGRAERELGKLDLGAAQIEEIVAPARALIPDLDFWMRAGDGLAVFLSANLERVHALPRRFEELMTVADAFHIKPLLPLLSEDQEFFVLALSKQQARLFSGATEGLQEVTPDELPQGVSQALRHDDPEQQLQTHTSAQATAGQAGGDVIHHGHGGNYDEKINLRRYFQEVDRHIQPILAGQRAPLVLASVDYLQPIYQQANTYNHLLQNGIPGNPEEWTAKQLHAKVWPLVEPIFQQRRVDAIESFLILAGNQSKRTISELEPIVQSAYSGQVETLFVPLAEQCWGSFDLNQNLVRSHAQYQPGDRDLLDLAAAYTLINAGQVFALPAEGIPGTGQVAAILRYAA
ncbi:MAG: hypothetical protein JW862_06660 [Anaerolineales bacterium]|nr:hypothetical protein [Anaerolineales bacterium]